MYATTKETLIANCRTWALSELEAAGWVKASDVAELHVGQVVVVSSHGAMRQSLVVKVGRKNIKVELTTPSAVKDLSDPSFDYFHKNNDGYPTVTSPTRAASETYYRPTPATEDPIAPAEAELDAERTQVIEEDAAERASYRAEEQAEIDAERAYLHQRYTDGEFNGELVDVLAPYLLAAEAELDAEIEQKVAEHQAQAGATFEQRAEIVTLAAGKPIRAHWLRMIVDLATAADGELSREDAATAIQMLRGLAAPRPKTGLEKIQTFQRRHGGLTRKGLTPKQARRVRKTIHKERKAYFELLELARTA